MDKVIKTVIKRHLIHGCKPAARLKGHFWPDIWHLDFEQLVTSLASECIMERCNRNTFNDKHTMRRVFVGPGHRCCIWLSCFAIILKGRKLAGSTRARCFNAQRSAGLMLGIVATMCHKFRHTISKPICLVGASAVNWKSWTVLNIPLLAMLPVIHVNPSSWGHLLVQSKKVFLSTVLCRSDFFFREEQRREIPRFYRDPEFMCP